MKAEDALRLYKGDEKLLSENLDRILSALGLATNAGGLAIGNEAVMMALRKGTARLVFITDDISGNSLDKLISQIHSAETKYIILPCGMNYLAEKLGKSGYTAAAALTRSGFEKIIFGYMDKSKTAKKSAKNVKSHDTTTEVH